MTLVLPPSSFRRIILFRWVAAICAALFFASPIVAAEENLRLVTPNDATSGTLMFEATTPGKYITAPALMTDVEIDISGPIARTRVTQRFENTTEGWVEGIYVFPLPDYSAVDTLRMQIGDRFIEGQIEERQKAKEIYKKAKAAGKKTALLEQERPNIFTNSVANIGPGETIIVQIEYQESLQLDNDKFSLRFPMVVAPRYNPAPQVILANLDETSGFAIADPVPDRARISSPVQHPSQGDINPVSLRINLQAGFPIGPLSSNFHDIDAELKSEAEAIIELAEGTVPANRDFELSWAPKSGTAPTAALFREEIDGTPYYLVMVTPPVGPAQPAAPAREIIFVIDTSGSMAGPSIRQARQSLALAISRLNPGDTFNVIEFNSGYTTLFREPQPAREQTIRMALDWTERLEANGGTEMLNAMRAALADHGTSGNRLRQVIFLTDGAIGNEQQLFETISTRRKEARVFPVGIGSAPNSYFMSRAAEIGQGSFTHIGNIGEVAEKMDALFTKLESPAVTNIAASWPAGMQVEAWPSPLPDIYRGETLTIAARAKKDEGTIWISGQNGDQPWRVGLDLAKAAERKGVSKLWARKKIASLELVRIRHVQKRDALDAQILETALTHHLVSRLTSLVAVDVTPSRPEDTDLERQPLPLNLPAGWEFDTVFGEKVPDVRYASLPSEMLRIRSDAEMDAALSAPNQRQAGIALPQTATLSDVKLLLGLLLLALAGFIAWGRRHVPMGGCA